MNEHELERLAQQLGAAAAERLDVEATAQAVLERLRLPEERRSTWVRPEWLRVAAALVVLLGAGVVLQRGFAPAAAAHYVLEDLRELSTAELAQVLAGLDEALDAEAHEVPLSDLESLTPAQLEALLRSLDT